jgi:hypothetical protein
MQPATAGRRVATWLGVAAVALVATFVSKFLTTRFAGAFISGTGQEQVDHPLVRFVVWLGIAADLGRQRWKGLAPRPPLGSGGQRAR